MCTPLLTLCFPGRTYSFRVHSLPRRIAKNTEFDKKVDEVFMKRSETSRRQGFSNDTANTTPCLICDL
jgi:hypothetical protein